MFHACRNKQDVAGLERMLNRTVLKNTPAAYDDVYFILGMRLLHVVAFRPVNFYGHGAVPE